jgi:hypothetical protein
MNTVVGLILTELAVVYIHVLGDRLKSQKSFIKHGYSVGLVAFGLEATSTTCKNEF